MGEERAAREEQMTSALGLFLAAVVLVALQSCESGGTRAAPGGAPRGSRPGGAPRGLAPGVTPRGFDASPRTLPGPRRASGASLAHVLATRRSRREFEARALGDDELGQLLWAGQGVIDDHRTAPSAGALYPITLRVVDATGVWRYDPAHHAAVRELDGDRRAELHAPRADTGDARLPPAILAITADIAAVAARYGRRAERYATLEAGHVAQNILLQATALGLAAVPIGAFDDAAVVHALGLPAGATPLYLIPVGWPAR